MLLTQLIILTFCSLNFLFWNYLILSFPSYLYFYLQFQLFLLALYYCCLLLLNFVQFSSFSMILSVISILKYHWLVLHMQFWNLIITSLPHWVCACAASSNNFNATFSISYLLHVFILLLLFIALILYFFSLWITCESSSFSSFHAYLNMQHLFAVLLLLVKCFMFLSS